MLAKQCTNIWKLTKKFPVYTAQMSVSYTMETWNYGVLTDNTNKIYLQWDDSAWYGKCTIPMMSEQAPTAVTYKYTHIIKYKVISVPKDFGKTYENYKLQ